jgi:SOS-response transcriptional repressor LexA
MGERHQKILDFIASYQREHKHPPSIREIGEYCDISSTSVVNYYLDQLEKDQVCIERDRKISRGVRLVNQWQLRIGDMLRVPVMGVIQAGEPIPDPIACRLRTPSPRKTTVDSRHCPLMPAKGKRQGPVRPQRAGRLHDRCHGQRWRYRESSNPTQDARNGEMVAVWLSDRERDHP